jgi:hypothetical protein
MLLPYGDFWLNGWGPSAGLTGSAALTWDAWTATGTATIPITATAPATLSPWTGSGVGAVLLTGAAAGMLDPWTGTGTGVLPLSGTAPITLSAWTGSGTAQIPITATLASAWAAWTATGHGTSSPTIPQHPGRMYAGELAPRDAATVGTVAAKSRMSGSEPYPKYPVAEEEPY